MSKNVTRISRHINAPRARVYDALVDENLIAQWKVPTGMTSHVHEFEAREGGTFRISLTYEEATQVGKTTAHTDIYHGRFVKLVPNTGRRRRRVRDSRSGAARHDDDHDRAYRC